MAGAQGTRTGLCPLLALAEEAENERNNQSKRYRTMSDKSKLNRKQRDELQEKKAQKVVAWIFGGLIFLGLCFLVYTTWLMN